MWTHHLSHNVETLAEQQLKSCDGRVSDALNTALCTVNPLLFSPEENNLGWKGP